MKLLKPTLTASLILIALPMVSAHAQELSSADKQKAAENVIQADNDDDGVLNRSEFKTLIKLNAADNIGKAKAIKRFGKYDKAFKRMDVNEDGFVSPDEMKSVIAQLRS